MSRRPEDLHLTTRRKFEPAIADLRRILAAPDMDDRDMVLHHATWNLYPFMDEVARDAQKARTLIDVTRAAREASGPGRDGAEEELMKRLDHVVHNCGDAFDAAGLDQFLVFPDCAGCPADLETPCTIMRDICTYALDCFTYTRPRDQFAGLRRAGAFQILGSAGWVLDIPSAMPLALAALKRDRRLEARGAIGFLDEYFRAREGGPAADEIDKQLLAFAERTDNRSNAAGALNLLVEAGAIAGRTYGRLTGKGTLLNSCCAKALREGRVSYGGGLDSRPQRS
ncbi:MAG: hypothetical protein FJ225_08625 [Lentisphaerae bacterium]|nr:hypothetical protein [Lentisphaerota bacterium]